MTLRAWIRHLAPLAIGMLGLLLITIQSIKHPAHMSELPAGTFLALITISTFCFGWVSINESLTSDQERIDVKLAGLDLFAASLLALVASAFTVIPEHPSAIIILIAKVGRPLHLVLLSFSYLFAWLGLTRMMRHFPDQ